MTEQPAELAHSALGVSIRLVPQDALRQRDLNKYMAAQREPALKALGDTDPEFLYRCLWAGVKSGIVKEARVNDRPEPLTVADLDDLAPARVRWLGQQVHSLYLRVWSIPPGSVVAAADYAEGKPDASPPLELSWMRECQTFPGALPEPGSLWDQPAGLLHRMAYLDWVFTVFRRWTGKSLVDWQTKDPDGWKLKCEIDRLRSSLPNAIH